MQSQELRNVLRAIRNLSRQEKQIVAKLLQGESTGTTEVGQPGTNDGNTDSEPSSDAQQRQ